MEVENYVQDLSHFNVLQNRYATKRSAATISRRAYDRIIREAKAMLADHAIDWTGYGPGEAIFSDMTSCQVEWTRIGGTAKIVVNRIFFDKATGAIHQAGTEYGDLSY